MTEDISLFIPCVSALYFLLTYYSIIELLLFKSAASLEEQKFSDTYSPLCLSSLSSQKQTVIETVKVFLLAYLTCVCDKCTRSARRLTWSDGSTSCIDSASLLCRRESPSVVQCSTATPASVVLWPVFCPLWQFDILLYLSMFAVHSTCL